MLCNDRILFYENFWLASGAYSFLKKIFRLSKKKIRLIVPISELWTMPFVPVCVSGETEQAFAKTNKQALHQPKLFYNFPVYSELKSSKNYLLSFLDIAPDYLVALSKREQ